MRIGLHDADKDPYIRSKKGRQKADFPNYALMKISAFHKSQGDSVEWWTPMLTDQFDKIYSSKVFDFTEENPFLPEWAIRGGTGYVDVPQNQELAPEIDVVFPDYTIYPACDYAIGFLTRGCTNNCPWCYVPAKEGYIRPYRSWRQIVRSDTDKLVLMDNNILACEHGVAQLADMIGSGYRIDANQGLDAALVTPDVADILARLDWMRFIRFSCDQRSRIKSVQRAVELLAERGVKPYNIFVYVLVQKDVEDAAYRVEQLKQYRGINLYGMPERNERKGEIPNALQREFAQRYIYGHCYLRETWAEYLERHKEKRLHI